MFHSFDSGMPVFPASMVIPDRSRTICISGHREYKLLPYRGKAENREITLAAVKLFLYRYIDMAAENGYSIFISGMAQGIDLWAAEYIICKKQHNEDIKLIGAIPFLKHAANFSSENKKLLVQTEKAADHLVVVCDNPDVVYGKRDSLPNISSTLYRDRNYWIVENSIAIIACTNGVSFGSGTSQTINYAKKLGKKVYGFNIDEVYSCIERNGADLRKIARETENIRIMEMQNRTP